MCYVQYNIALELKSKFILAGTNVTGHTLLEPRPGSDVRILNAVGAGISCVFLRVAVNALQDGKVVSCTGTKL